MYLCDGLLVTKVSGGIHDSCQSQISSMYPINVSYDLLKITSETKEPSNTRKNYERASLNEAV